MKNVTDYKDKNVLVVGLGKSGLNSAYLLKELGANVTVNSCWLTSACFVG